MPKVVLSHKQFVFILYVYLIGASMLFIPEARFAGKDAWISTIAAILISMVLLAAWLHLQRKYPGMSLIQYGIKVMGPWIGYPLGFYLVFIMFVIASLIIEDMTILASSIMLPNTPPGIIRLSFILVALYVCYKGVESIGRMCELVFIPLTLLILILPLLGFQQLGLTVFQPVFLIDWYGVTIGTVSALIFPFAEIFIPAMLLPFVSIDRESEKYYHLTILAAGMILLIRTGVGLMIFEPDLLTRFSLPIVAVFRVVELGDFINRVEGLFMGLWYIGLQLKLAITFYAGTLALSQLIGVKRLENMWIPVAALMFFVSETRFPNQSEFRLLSFFVLPFLALPGEVIWPLVLVTVDRLKGNSQPAAVDKLNKGHD
jgi:spore germination protein KB